MRIILVVLALLAAELSAASDWMPVAPIIDGGLVFIDRGSVVALPGYNSGKKAWFHFTYGKEKTVRGISGDEAKYLSAKVFVLFDCDSRRSSEERQIYYAGNGDVVWSDDRSLGWREPVPDSVGESMFDAACAGKELTVAQEPAEQPPIEPTDACTPARIRAGECRASKE